MNKIKFSAQFIAPGHGAGFLPENTIQVYAKGKISAFRTINFQFMGRAPKVELSNEIKMLITFLRGIKLYAVLTDILEEAHGR